MFGIKCKIRLPKVTIEQLKKDIDAAVIRAEKNFIANEFSKEVDPYGKKWEPKKVPNGNKILIDTKKMRNSFKYTRRGISNAKYYSSFHQTGTKKMPRRAMFPYRGLKGSSLKAKIDRSIGLVLKKNGL